MNVFFEYQKKDYKGSFLESKEERENGLEKAKASNYVFGGEEKCLGY